ncbi:MAG: hypothetical protein KBB86_02400 [Candidatus Pacebacteria bacterium]|nr:hypothetical protein [Candidatus Paceibacterota bacterium]
MENTTNNSLENLREQGDSLITKLEAAIGQLEYTLGDENITETKKAEVEAMLEKMNAELVEFKANKDQLDENHNAEVLKQIEEIETLTSKEEVIADPVIEDYEQAA